MMLSSITRPVSYALQQNDINRKNRVDTSHVSFKDILSQAVLGELSVPVTSVTESSNSTSNINSYLSHLQFKFGAEISVQHND